MVLGTVPLQINKINKNNCDNKKNNNAVNTQYSVKQNVFNPDKFSPPNQWNIRLLNRFSRFKKNVEYNMPMISM